MPQACPSGYSALSEADCSPDSVGMDTNGWESGLTTENVAGYPKGCYTVIQSSGPYTMYWNRHPTGTNDHPNVQAKRLCKKDGAPPPKFSFSAKNTNGSCPSGYRAPTKGECTKDNLGTLITGNFYEEIEQSQPNFPKGCYRWKGANLVWNPHGTGSTDPESAPVCIRE